MVLTVSGAPRGRCTVWEGSLVEAVEAVTAAAVGGEGEPEGEVIWKEATGMEMEKPNEMSGREGASKSGRPHL